MYFDKKIVNILLNPGSAFVSKKTSVDPSFRAKYEYIILSLGRSDKAGRN
jgi:hypothetical protein